MTLLYDPTTKNFVDGSLHSAPKYGLLVPNRLFVGGLGAEITEEDLRGFFSTYGPIKHCKILSDSSGMSKGYGFVTFVSADDVEKLLKNEGEQVIYKDRKLNIGPAVRKQGALPQMLAGAQNVGSSMMPGGIIYANGVPCMMQGPPTSAMLPLGTGSNVLPMQDRLAYPQLMSLPSGGIQMMMVHPQYFAHHGALIQAGSPSAAQQAGLQRGSLQLGGGMPMHLDPATELSHLLSPSASNICSPTATLIQGLTGQQPILLPTSQMTLANPGAGLEQYLCQFPYMLQQQQGQAVMPSNSFGHSLTGVEALQQKFHQQQKHAYALAESLPCSLQYFELPKSLTQSQSPPTNSSSPQTPSHHKSVVSFASDDSPSTINESKGTGIKRVLNMPYQTICNPTYAGSAYGLPAVKILAGQGQQRIVTQALDPTDMQVLTKNLK